MILARAAPIGVVFRRGPTRQVQLIHWNTTTDQFTPGQWFKGRIYERRCDLSPDGSRLIYFAAKHTGPLYSWTAISRPPYLTALVLWPKGDCWDGGGLFESEDRIWLNHPASVAQPQQGAVPEHIGVVDNGEQCQLGEDGPIEDRRMERDGWRTIQKLEARSIRRSWIPDGLIDILRTHPDDPASNGTACEIAGSVAAR